MAEVAQSLGQHLSTVQVAYCFWQKMGWACFSPTRPVTLLFGSEF
jgi:hypothetical protein